MYCHFHDIIKSKKKTLHFGLHSYISLVTILVPALSNYPLPLSFLYLQKWIEIAGVEPTLNTYV